ncbi:E3 ubiquitin-protein ligase SGR9, amyloplastic-like [Lycium barbarum]|uniref:E3 ubiquitin-protein ligase SGR9, amyloplastic-like n=1 Tax=Lycium barbarum TaxID=112863 RepID=UPI00293F0705|nr:E3 ubiquitin-protein ligase SGR9, amyloplastic-like [Lycium barbarum]
MNNVVDYSSTPVEIQFSTKTIHRWIEIDNSNGTQDDRRLCVVHQEEEEEIEQDFSLHLSADVSIENYGELISSKLCSNLPSLDLEKVGADYRFIEKTKEIIRVSFVVLLYQNYVCDKTRFERQASLSLIKSLKKKKMMNSDENGCCAICLGDLGVGTQVNCMPCSHYFHIRCLGNWLERRGNCPICRYEMSTQSGTDLE